MDQEGCSIGWRGNRRVILKINFSVPVNMYSENVTSYW
jgi:hypothetical protein